MKPHYIRFIVPSNANSRFNVPSPGGIRFISIRPSILPQNLTSACQIISNTKSETPAAVPPPLLSSTPETVDISDEIASENITNPPISISAEKTLPTASLSSTNVPTDNLTTTDAAPILDSNSNVATSSSPPKSSNSSTKRSRPPSLEKKQLDVKKTTLKIKKEEINPKAIRRGKNWSEDETVAFIGVWAEYYSKLTTGNKRHSPTYHAMAEQLNDILSPRCLSAQDVKGKIGNLITEFRRKKKEQGKTGASPCTWPYFDLIDEIIGQRPYNDDNLLSDSMITEQEDTLDLNATQISKQAEESFSLTSDIEKLSPIHNDNISSESPSSDRSIVKCSTSMAMTSSAKKPSVVKKKKAADLKCDLMKQLIGKIDDANTTVAESESKMLQLLEKQTQLQAESVQNDKEFLNVFKILINNITSAQ